MAELDVGIITGHLRYHLPPQLRDLEHVRLVDGAHSAIPLERQIEGYPGDSLDLVLGVDVCVEAAALVVPHFDAPRLAKVDAAGKLAND